MIEETKAAAGATPRPGPRCPASSHRQGRSRGSARVAGNEEEMKPTRRQQERKGAINNERPRALARRVVTSMARGGTDARPTVGGSRVGGSTRASRQPYIDGKCPLGRALRLGTLQLGILRLGTPRLKTLRPRTRQLGTYGEKFATKESVSRAAGFSGSTPRPQLEAVRPGADSVADRRERGLGSCFRMRAPSMMRAPRPRREPLALEPAVAPQLLLASK